MNRFAAKATMAALAQLCIGLSAHAGGSADLGVTVAGPTQSPAGLQVNYTVTITNNGPDAATGVELIVQLTDGFDFQAVDGNCSAATPCTFPSIAAGDTATYVARVCISREYPDGGQGTVAASVSAQTGDSDLNNNLFIATTTVLGGGFADGFDCDN